MSTITLPSQFLPKSFTLKQQTSQRVSASPFGGSEQAIDLLNDRWVASAELVQNNYENSAYIESFIASMRGQVNNVALYHFARPQPRGTLRGTLTLDASAAQGARSIVVTGCTPAYSTLKAGDMLGVGGLLAMVQSDCSASGMNLLPYSEQIDNAAWTKIGLGVASAPIVTANYGVAPDASNTADRVVFALNGGSTTSDSSNLQPGPVSVISNINYTLSFYAKTTDGTTKTLQLRCDTTVINLSTLITVTSAFQRYSFSFLTTGVSLAINLRLRGAQGTSDSADILLWGAQLERGSAATTYTPTTSTAIDSTITVPITNALRTAKSAGTAVTWDKPTALFRLLSTEGVQYTAGMTSTVSLEFGEAI